MKKIKKGNKATINGYIITEAEKEEYIELKNKTSTDLNRPFPYGKKKLPIRKELITL